MGAIEAYKLISLLTVFIASFSFFYTLDRRVFRISKYIVPLVVLNLAAAVLEFIKFEYHATQPVERIQDSILLYLPVLYYLFLRELSLRKGLPRRQTILLLGVPTVYFILALTDPIHNAFWSGTRPATWYVETIGLRPGPVLYTYYVFVMALATLVVTEIVRFFGANYTYVERMVVVTYGLGWFLSLWAFFFAQSYTLLFFFIATFTMALELTAIRSFWRKSVIGVRFKLFELSDYGYVATDKKGNVIDVNSKAEELLGVSAGNVIGRKVTELRIPTGTEEGLIERGGRLILVRRESTKLGDALILKDVTQEIVGAKKQREINELMRALFENIPEGAVILREDGRVVDCNKRFEDMFGYTKEEMIGRRIEEFIVPPELMEEPPLIRKTALEQGAVKFRTIRKRKSGENFEVEVNVVRVNVPQERLLYAIYTDISLEREFMRTSQMLLTRDRLTGLYNKEYFVKRLISSEEEGNSAYPYNVVVLLDILDFNLINVSKGHNFGDQLLRKVAERLTEILRKDDVIARGTSDEFWILFRNFASTFREALSRLDGVLSKIFDRLESPFEVEGEVVELKFRAGVYVYEHDSYEEVLKKASIALNEAKNRNVEIFVYEPELDVKYVSLLEREKYFREAFYSGRVLAFFQPVCTSTGRIVGAEALLRVIDPSGTIFPPMDFIPLIERNGMIHIVGEEVLRQSCELLRKTTLRFVNINVSPIQLANRTFAERFYDIVLQNSIEPSRIVVEITENIILGHNESALSNLRALEKLGFELCIDDFGTGYSSLQYLVDYPIKKLKVDRSFVKELESREKKSIKILEAIHSLASSLGIEAIPEGVETNKQLQILTMIGYKFFQGFLFSKAVTMEQFTKMMIENVDQKTNDEV